MTEESESEEEGSKELIRKLGDEFVDSASKEGKKTLNQIIGAYAEYVAYRYGKLGEVLSATEKLRSDAAEEVAPIDVTPDFIELASQPLEKLDLTENDVLEDVHKYHLSFALSTYLIEFDDFLQAISELKPEDRDALFDHVYHEVIHPEYRPEDGKTMAECYYPRVNYDNFKNQVWSRDYHCAPHNVHQWVVTALNTACHMGKSSNVQAIKLKRDASFEHLQKLLKHAEGDEEKDLITKIPRKDVRYR